MIWCQHLKKKFPGSYKQKFLFFWFNLFDHIFRSLIQTILAMKGMIKQLSETIEYHKTHKNPLNFCCIKNKKPETGCFPWHCCTPQRKGRLSLFELYVIKGKMILLVDIDMRSLFNAILCRRLMLHDIFKNRKSCQISNLRPHESSTLFSKTSSSSPTLCSIKTPCFGIV